MQHVEIHVHCITSIYEHGVRVSFSWTRTFLSGYHDNGLEVLRQIGKKLIRPIDVFHCLVSEKAGEF